MEETLNELVLMINEAKADLREDTYESNMMLWYRLQDIRDKAAAAAGSLEWAL